MAQLSAGWLSRGFLSAPDHASGCPKRRTASANQLVGPRLVSIALGFDTGAIDAQLLGPAAVQLTAAFAEAEKVHAAYVAINPNPSPHLDSYPNPDPRRSYVAAKRRPLTIPHRLTMLYPLTKLHALTRSTPLTWRCSTSYRRRRAARSGSTASRRSSTVATRSAFTTRPPALTIR